MEKPPLNNNSGIDKVIFYGSLIALLAFVFPLFIWPEWSQTILGNFKKFIDGNFSYLYQWLAIFVTIFSFWLALSRYGKIKLGKSKIEFSNFSWGSMLFCAGVATGILYWGSIEWAFYMITPPFGVEPFSDEAIEWAATYGMFHWGITGWGFYALPAIAIGHAFYNLGIPSMRISVACRGVLGRFADGYFGKVLDILFMIGLLGSSGTSLGLGTPMIAAGLDELFGIGTSFEVKLVVISLCSIVFATSVYLGLTKGIKRLSNLNTTMAFVFLGIILLAGPTVFILKMMTNSIGLMGQNFIRMITWTDPVNNTNFVEDWSIFYWSWWVAVGPFMGLFIARISGGRSIKQIILGTIILGSTGCMLFYGIFGNYALHLELSEVFSSTALVVDGQAPQAIIQVVKSLPFGTLMLLFFVVMSIVFMATSFDSTSYILATVSSKGLTEGIEPQKWYRLFWAFLLVVLPVALMLVGGLESLKTTVLISALPLIVVYVFMILSILKWVKQFES